MKSFFNPDNFIFRWSTTIFDIIVLSIFWVVCSLPVVTIGTSTAALYYSAVKCVRFKQPDTYKNFWNSFKENLKTGIAFTVVYLVLAFGMFVIYTAIVGTMPLQDALSVPVIWGFLLFCVFLYATFLCGVILLSRFSCTLSSLLTDSFRITFGHLFRMYGAALLATAVLLLTVHYFYYQVWFATPCLAMLAISVLTEPILRKYTPNVEELMKLPLVDRPWYLQ